MHAFKEYLNERKYFLDTSICRKKYKISSGWWEIFILFYITLPRKFVKEKLVSHKIRKE